MTELSGAETADLFDKKGTQILYIGRPTCGVCVSLVPELNKAIDELNLTVYYSELTSAWQTDFAGIFDKLTVKTTINSEEATIGELLKSHGYTTTVIIIKDGKMVDGFIGYRASDALVELFNKYL